MAKEKKMVEPEAPKSEAGKEQLEHAVDLYLGIHPKYLVWGAQDVHVDWPMLQHDGVNFSGFKPYLENAHIL